MEVKKKEKERKRMERKKRENNRKGDECCVSVCTQVRTGRAREKTTQQQILLEIPALQVV
jgi:hypothetical protein